MIQIIPVNKIDEDAKLIMEWRNDDDTRKNSFNQEVKEWDKFKNEFYNNYFNNIPLFAVMNNQKIAFISFLYTDNNDTLKIGINLDPNYRGKGLSTDIIKLSINYIKQQYPDIKSIIADIKEFNIPSIKTFTNADFKFDHSFIQNDTKIMVYLYLCHI